MVAIAAFDDPIFRTVDPAQSAHAVDRRVSAQPRCQPGPEEVLNERRQEAGGAWHGMAAGPEFLSGHA